MKKTLSLLLFAFFCFNVSFSQTYIKTNGLYWLAGIPNISGETKLSDRFTFNIDCVYSPWESFFGYKFKFVQVIPEVRFFFKQSFKGFYGGFYSAAHRFNMTKWNYRDNKHLYQKGWGASLGATLGYQHQISKRWQLDSYLGGGWQISRYRGYNKKTNERYIGLNNSGEWLPYKIGIAFAYKL